MSDLQYQYVAGVHPVAGYTVDGVHPRDPALKQLFGLGMQNHAKVDVNHDTVMALPAVFRAVDIISNGVKRMPFYVFKKGKDDLLSYDKDHPSWTSVTKLPNEEITAGEFRKSMTAWALLWGNAVAYMHRPGWPASKQVEYIPLLPDRTRPVRITPNMANRYDIEESLVGKLYYETYIDSVVQYITADSCFHIKGLGPNPYWGYDVVDALRQSFGGVIAASEFGQRFYGQGAMPAGFVEIPAGLDEEAEARFAESLKRGAEGMGRAHRLMLMEEGAKFTPWMIDPEKAQFLEGKEFDVRTMAMALRIKPHKLIDSANSAFASLESANHEHKDDDLLPWVETWTEQYNRKALTGDEFRSESHVIAVDDEYLDWVPFAERADGVVKLYQGGIINREEGRRRINFGPSMTRNGNRFQKPMNITWEDEEVEVTSRGRPAGQETQHDGAVLADAWLGKTAARLAKQAKAKAGKGSETFTAWLDSVKPEASPVLQAETDALYRLMIEQLTAIDTELADTELADTELAETVKQWADHFISTTYKEVLSCAVSST